MDRRTAVGVGASVAAMANLGVGTMVFGQFLRQQPFSSGVALAGVAFWLVLIALTLVLAGGKQ